MGVKVPDSGTADSVEGRLTLAEAEELGVGESFLVGVGEAETLPVGVKDPEGVEVKAGKSLSPAASTVKDLVIFLKVPPASLKEIVIECSPGSRSSGGVQAQFPRLSTVTDPLTGVSEKTSISIICPGSPVPRNCGSVELISSSFSGFTIVVFDAPGDADSPTSKPDEGELSGIVPKEDVGGA